MTADSYAVEPVMNIKWGALVLLGFLAVIFGLLIVLFPALSATILVELIGVLILLLAFSTIILAALSPGGWKESALLAILGILGFIFGIATIVQPMIMGDVIFTIVGVALFLVGIIDIVFAVSEPAMTHRGLFAFKGLIAIVLGLLIAILPLVGVALMVIWAAVLLMIYGIASIALGYLVHSVKTA
ncbi:MAG: DUF308 domain-containing protein [Methanoregula sp.]|jgi:uncharacterized membrane protein HdeD (DUF308 family)